MASILVVFSSTPYKGAAPTDSLDFAMSATAYGHTVDVIFIDDGVFQLLDSTGEKLAYKTKQPSKIAKSLSFFDIENTYVCLQSMDSRMIKLDTLSAHYTCIDASDVRRLIDSHTFVVNL